MSTPTNTSTTAPWRIVAEREVRARFREKSFIWGFVAMVVISWAGLVALDYFGDRDTTYDVGVVGAEAGFADGLEKTLGDGYVVKTKDYDDRAAAEEAITAGDLDAALVGADQEWTLVADNDIDAPLEAAVGRPSGPTWWPGTPPTRASTSRRSTRARPVSGRPARPDAEDLGHASSWPSVSRSSSTWSRSSSACRSPRAW